MRVLLGDPPIDWNSVTSPADEDMNDVLQPAAEAAGLGRGTWHQFRHIHSPLLNDLYVPVKIAQVLLRRQGYRTDFLATYSPG